ncbi:MAG TPA: leucyl aminopeptidase [Gammaproteobacteria bacterium]|jgi:leucyl aminopeptidase|nr:leucyl aminopeptidase [Gammaproteobacteria bacterium]
MKIAITTNPIEKQSKTCLMVGVFENGDLTPTAKMIDKISKGYLTKLVKNGDFLAKFGQTLSLFHLPHSQLAHVLLVGCGKPGKLSPIRFRKLMSGVVKTLNPKVTTITCYLTELSVDGEPSLPWKVKQLAEAAAEGAYQFDLFKTEKEPARASKEIWIHLANKQQLKPCQIALQQSIAIAEGVQVTKNLANLPSNICTPTFVAEQAKELAKIYSNMTVKVLSEKDMAKLGMGAILGVAQGSIEPAQLVCLEYKGTRKKQAPVALVGKGVTFDSGGNSLKPADSMVGMKYDMCGAATVLGTFKAVAELKLPIHLVGVMPLVENMPGGTAYKPEDILTSMSGQTIEIISTDAEGRVILSDALTYCERYKPDVVIDIATLTGAVVVALGFHATGLLSNDESLAKALLKAGEESNDRAWQLPLWDDYQEQLKSPFADMTNSGGRSGGVITAACFLSRFTKKFRWAHLDVAGTAAMMMGVQDRMATGRPVPLLVQYLLDRER